MTIKTFMTLVVITLAVSACAGGGVPGKSEVQGAVDRLAVQEPMLWGADKPIVKDTKCTKTGNDTYECVASIATSGDPAAHPVTVKMTKLNGQWTAQIANILQ